MSPVAWSKHPSFARDADVVSRLLSKGTIMCREEITPFYIRSALRDDEVAVWLVRDANERIFGFALTKQHPTHVELKLICTHRRNGEGTKLFDEILAHTRSTQQELRLEAVNAKVALLYANAARRAGHAVLLDDGSHHAHHNAPLAYETLKQTIRALELMIPMRFRPPSA